MKTRTYGLTFEGEREYVANEILRWSGYADGGCVSLNDFGGTNEFMSSIVDDCRNCCMQSEIDEGEAPWLYSGRVDTVNVTNQRKFRAELRAKIRESVDRRIFINPRKHTLVFEGKCYEVADELLSWSGYGRCLSSDDLIHSNEFMKSINEECAHCYAHVDMCDDDPWRDDMECKLVVINKKMFLSELRVKIRRSSMLNVPKRSIKNALVFEGKAEDVANEILRWSGYGEDFDIAKLGGSEGLVRLMIAAECSGCCVPYSFEMTKVYVLNRKVFRAAVRAKIRGHLKSLHSKIHKKFSKAAIQLQASASSKLSFKSAITGLYECQGNLHPNKFIFCDEDFSVLVDKACAGKLSQGLLQGIRAHLRHTMPSSNGLAQAMWWSIGGGWIKEKLVVALCSKVGCSIPDKWKWENMLPVLCAHPGLEWLGSD